jgi:cyclopropane-fatty-acyl-phospholipid synthase
MNMASERWLAGLLAPADIHLNGSRPSDPQILNPKTYGRILSQGTVGLGESYMDGWWTCEKLDELFSKAMGSGIDRRVRLSPAMIWTVIKAKLFNLQSRGRAFIVGEKHYDLGNDLFIPMLGPSMAYSCAYWDKATSLDEAQYAKFDLICRKLGLRPGMKVLDIGCGWGGLAKYAAEKYGVSVIGLTVSREQAEFATNLCQGLPVEIRVQDYRACTEKVDRIVSVGMFEHVGSKNYRSFMRVAKSCLKDDGLFLLHTIGSLRSVLTTDPWIAKYVFPNGMLPSMKQIARSAERIFVIEDVHNFGADYDKTLMAWHRNFVAAWPSLREKYGERFFRMWTYYLLTCAGAFRVRKIQLWQIVLSPSGVKGGYKSVR